MKREVYAVMFKDSEEIYETLSSNIRPYGLLAIFVDKKGAEKWIEAFCKEEAYKPEIKKLKLYQIYE